MKSLKSACLAMAIVSIGLVVALGARVDARSPSESSTSKIMTGKVALVEGEFQIIKDPHGEDTLKIVDTSYVITNQAGEEVRLKLDNNTKVRERVNPGDKIVATISPRGQILSVTRLEP